MAVIINTNRPSQLLALLKQQIADKKIETWVDENNYFTHKPSQWYRLAWFKPSAGMNTLTFFIVPPKGGSISSEIYAIYHGRFIEMFLAHFDQSFSQATATALPVSGDITKSDG